MEENLINSKKSSKKSSTLVMLGPFPPVLGGASFVNNSIFNILSQDGFHIIKLNSMQLWFKNEHKRSFFLYFLRIVKFAKNFFTLIFYRVFHSSFTLYLVPDAGKGFLFTFCYFLLGFIFCEKIIIHHHTHKYFNKKYFLFYLMSRLSTKKVFHVFLDISMKLSYENLYSKRFKFFIFSNIHTNDIGLFSFSTNLKKTKITIGFLSNLSTDKGFDVIEYLFINLYNIYQDKINFKIGGMPVDKESEIRLNNLIFKLGDSLEYCGQVFHEQKFSFYNSVDIFVFPTRFDQEGQPRVIFEALASGCFIISTCLAGIPLQVDSSFSKLVNLDSHFRRNFFRETNQVVKSFNFLNFKDDQKLFYDNLLFNSDIVIKEFKEFIFSN